ncbi:MAG: bifunctional phosphoribosyl-AMP cyclohydrolase/phosphoribosyl-ATP diphosphatase HisIE [Sandaracinaceae bacterium]
MELELDERGLVTVVAQDRASGEVRMVAFADRTAIDRTIETGLAHFHSRSRGRLWQKGEESGHVLHVREVWIDCDADAVLYLVDPVGPTCHTGAATCFSRRVHPAPESSGRAQPVLGALEATLESRASADAGKSYTRSLLDAGPSKIAAKVREEADEVGRALTSETDERVVSEVADLVYHAMVGLIARQRSLRDVALELARRFGVSGHDEKASRQTPTE